MRARGTQKTRTEATCSHKTETQPMASKQSPAMCKTGHEHAANEKTHKPRVHTRHDNMKARSQWIYTLRATQHKIQPKCTQPIEHPNCVQHNKPTWTRVRGAERTENGARVSEPPSRDQNSRHECRDPKHHAPTWNKARRWESARLEHTRSRCAHMKTRTGWEYQGSVTKPWITLDRSDRTLTLPPPQKGRHLASLMRDTKNKTETWQHTNMTTQRLTHNNRPDKNNQNTETKRGGREGSQASASREAQQDQGGKEGWAREAHAVQGSWQGARAEPEGRTMGDPAEQEPWRMAMAGWTREDPGRTGSLANSQGGAGGTDQGGSGRTGTLVDGQGGAGGTDQAGSSQSGGQRGASCLAGCQGGPGRTRSLDGTAGRGHLRGAGRTRSLGGAGRAAMGGAGRERRLGGAGRARSLGSSGTASWPADISGTASRPWRVDEAFFLLLLRFWEWDAAASSATTGGAGAIGQMGALQLHPTLLRALQLLWPPLEQALGAPGPEQALERPPGRQRAPGRPTRPPLRCSNLHRWGTSQEPHKLPKRKAIQPLILHQLRGSSRTLLNMSFSAAWLNPNPSAASLNSWTNLLCQYPADGGSSGPWTGGCDRRGGASVEAGGGRWKPFLRGVLFMVGSFCQGLRNGWGEDPIAGERLLLTKRTQKPP